jgi:hypothetical protein
MDAGRVSDVDIGVADCGAVAGGLGNRVYLGVDGAVAILLEITVGCARFIDEASDLGAMPAGEPL